MSLRLHGGRVSGNREVSRESQREQRAVTWKRGFVGEHGFPHGSEAESRDVEVER
ncbi:hypothetical protein BH18ACT14_BH18ACT14_09540 [soil metagenome]